MNSSLKLRIEPKKDIAIIFLVCDKATKALSTAEREEFKYFEGLRKTINNIVRPF
jgi:hypothetical protein